MNTKTANAIEMIVVMFLMIAASLLGVLLTVLGATFAELLWTFFVFELLTIPAFMWVVMKVKAAVRPVA